MEGSKDSKRELVLSASVMEWNSGELRGKQLTVKVCGAGRMAASDQAWSSFEGPILDWRVSGAAEPHDFRQTCLWGETVLQEAHLVRQHLSSPTVSQSKQESVSVKCQSVKTEQNSQRLQTEREMRMHMISPVVYTETIKVSFSKTHFQKLAFSGHKNAVVM